MFLNPRSFSIEQKVRISFAFALACLMVIGGIAVMSSMRLTEENDQVHPIELVIATNHIAVMSLRIVLLFCGLAFVCVAVALFLIGRDFAGNRRAEVALTQLKEQLEEHVLTRTRELAASHEAIRHNQSQMNVELERRVIERTAELDAVNKELEAFSYSVSHDLRAPLRAVDGFSQAVLEDYGQVLPEQGLYYLKTIREGAQKMGVLIDDLLKFSRLCRESLNKRKVNTLELVNEVLGQLQQEVKGRQIDLQVGALPACWGDPALLRQVWINLLSNAFKYTRKQEVALIEIGCNQTPVDDVYFVKDNGTGFSMQYISKLFKVFQRLHCLEEFEGTGVGLAIVERIIQRHGGRIWAEAEVNHGATFYFTLKQETEL